MRQKSFGNIKPARGWAWGWRGDPFLRYRYSQAVPVGFSPQSRLRAICHGSCATCHMPACLPGISSAAPSDEPEEARLFRVVDSAHAKARGGSAWEWPRPPQLQRRLGQGAWPGSCHSCTTPLTVKKEPASGKTLPHGAQKTSANYVILITSNRETPARKPNSPTHINAEGD